MYTGKVADKIFMGRDIKYVAIWPKEGDIWMLDYGEALAP